MGACFHLSIFLIEILIETEKVLKTKLAHDFQISPTFSLSIVNPLLSLPGAYLFQAHLRGARRGRIWEGGGTYWI